MSREGKKRKASSEGETALDQAVNYFVTVEDGKKVRANINFSMFMDCLLKGAADEGLKPDQITLILDVAASGKFPDAISSKLIRCLIPATTVPLEAAAKAISWMCTNKPSSAIQTLMMRWLVLVYKEEGILEGKDKLRGLYSMIFYFLQNEAMCPHVCHLLYQMTRKEDVRLFRVQPLLQLQQKLGTQPYILGLLSIYKLFRPDLVSIVIPRTCKVFFRDTDKVWAAQIRNVQLAHKRRENQTADPSELESTTAETSSLRVKQRSKKKRQELIPGVSTAVSVSSSRVNDLVAFSPFKPVPFSQIRSFSDLLQNLDRLELPSQMAAVLKDQNLQHVLLCYPDSSIANRLAYWLDHVLYEEFFVGQRDQGRCEELLVMLIKFSDFLQEGVPVCEEFLSSYLHIWNGVEHRPYILKLITRFRLRQFDKLNDLVLEPLRKLFFSSSLYIKCEILLCLTELLKNYAAVEWPRYKYTLQLQRDKNNVAQSYVETPNCFSVFAEDIEEYPALETIVKLVSFVDRIVAVSLTGEGDHALLLHCALSFFDTVASLYPQNKIPFVQLPADSIIYRSLFSGNAMSVARVCHLVVCCCETLHSLRQLDSSQLPEEEQEVCSKTTGPRGQVAQLNTYILDISDTLWRQRAFNSKEENTVYKLLTKEEVESVKKENLKKSFSLAHHQALVGFAAKFFKATQPEDSAVHPSALVANKDIQDVYLQYLDQAEIFGIPKFISKFIPRKAKAQNK